MSPRFPPHHCGPPPPEIQQAMTEIYGTEDMLELDLFRKLWGTSHLLKYLFGEYRKDGVLSSARMRLLIRLLVEHKLGRTEGLLPSELSDFLGVSRNTVSALLNGLEEHGLIERHLHPTDRRQVLISITPAGEEIVCTRAPLFARYVSGLFEPLSPEERQTLAALLDKLFVGLMDRIEAMGLEVPGPESETTLEED